MPTELPGPVGRTRTGCGWSTLCLAKVRSEAATAAVARWLLQAGRARVGEGTGQSSERVMIVSLGIALLVAAVVVVVAGVLASSGSGNAQPHEFVVFGST